MTESDYESDLILNNIEPNTIARKLYEQLKNEGLGHKDALITVINGIRNLQSNSFNDKQIDIIKHALRNVKGIFS